MFSHLGREEFQASNQRYENLLDVLQRVGLAVLWIDNQSGCKGVCERIPSVSTANLEKPGLCSGGECQDEVMLRELTARLAELDAQRIARGAVVVMHQMGSHGPAYYKRTTGPYKKFFPECAQAALQNCSKEQIVNAYDNSIRYTDYLLTETVKWLQARGGPTAMVYISDHGESLGEKGLYLHGMPYRMAPSEQIHVPMILWVSPSLAQRQQLNVGCLRNTADRPLSHDNLFHTMLSLAQVQTTLHLPRLSVLEECYVSDASNPASLPGRESSLGSKA
jgi:lipid A ethanolaminephosphotransferase